MAYIPISQRDGATAAYRGLANSSPSYLSIPESYSKSQPYSAVYNPNAIGSTAYDLGLANMNSQALDTFNSSNTGSGLSDTQMANINSSYDMFNKNAEVGMLQSGPDSDGIGGWLDKMGITSKDGDIFGINKAQQQGLGQIAGLGAGVWNMYNANRQYGMMKDYYGKQMQLQEEQMGRVRKEDARMEGLRSGLSARYGSN